MVLGHIEQFVSPELDTENRNRLRSELIIMPGYHVGTMLIKRESFQQVGLFREDLELAEVIDWFSRAKEMKLHYKMLPEVVMKRRIHKTNQGIYKREYRTEYLKVLRATLYRRRAENNTNINKVSQ
jgi:GT2 family glycosyltransferase